MTTHEDTDYTFAAADFNFFDADSHLGDALSSVKIVNLVRPGKGTLKLRRFTRRDSAELPKTVTKAQPWTPAN